MSEKVLSKEQESALRAATTTGDADAVHSAGVIAWQRIWATLDAAREERNAALAAEEMQHEMRHKACAERDAALAEVERMRPCAEACEDVFVSYPDGHLLPDPGFKCWKAGKAFRASAQKEA